MPRVASLYLPNLAVDRLRRADARSSRPPEPQDPLPPADAQPPAAAQLPLAGRSGAQASDRQTGPSEVSVYALAGGDRVAEVALTQERAERHLRETLQAARQARAAGVQPPHAGAQTSGPGGWRPGARWAQSDMGSADWLDQRLARKQKERAALQAQIDTLPLHQRPAMRELGRRSEAAPVPFRAMPADEVGRLLDRNWRMTGPPPSPPAAETKPLAASGRSQSFADPAEIEKRLARTGLAQSGRPRLAREGFAPDPGGAGAGSAGPRQAEAHDKAGTQVRYDLQGAFWHAGRTLGQAVRRATDPRPDRQAPEPTSLPPLVTATRVGNKTVIAAACPAAQALGLHPGQALTLARASVRGLDVRDADPDGDRRFLERLARFAARRWTPEAALSGADGLWLGLTGVAHLHGGEARFCHRLIRFMNRLGFAARVAVADTAGAAHALARHAQAAVTLCPQHSHADAIAPLPLGALRIAREEIDPLRRLGLERIADLLAIPRGPLVRRFGPGLVHRLDQALGHAPEPIVPVDVPETPRALRRLLEPISTAEAIAQVIGDLCTDLCATLAARGRGARRLLLTCRRVDGADQPVAVGTARATRDPRHLAKLLGRRIETIDPGFGVEAMALAAWATEPLGSQAIAGALTGEPPVPDLAPLVDQLVGRLGTRRLYRLVAVESDVPERSVATHDPLGGGSGWPPDWPRPTRMLNPPEPVQNVLAEMPDHPPRRFTWRGHTHRVVAGEGPERVFGEWWRRPEEANAVRDYFRVEDADGHRFWLFRRGDGLDGSTGDLSWHIQGLFG